MTEHFDVVVIGGGSTGENVAAYARHHGLSVALVERELVGGECSYWACMPSKALLRPGEVLAAVSRVPAARAAVTGVVDVAKALETRDAFASHWDDRHQVAWVESTGTTLVRGHGRLTGERTVEVTADDGSARTLVAGRGVVLATGTSAAMPPIEGLDTLDALDSRKVTALRELPDSIVILGGGVVGVEMAQALHRLGTTDVTIVEMADRLLATEEPFVGEELREAFASEGIDVHVGATVVRVARDDNGRITVTLEDSDEPVVGDELLVATGRQANTQDVGLETVGLTPGDYVTTDDRLLASDVAGDWLYAVGDVNGRALLTHHGKYQARIVGELLAGVDVEARGEQDTVVRVVFTDPQVAAVGLTSTQAAERGIDVDTLTYGVGDVAGAALMGKGVQGTAQLLVDRTHRTIIGATFTGPGTAEMLHAATIAIIAEVTLDRLWHAIPAFPTISEVWLRLLEVDRGTA